jgi:uncharacterized protein (TIGR03067 family)
VVRKERQRLEGSWVIASLEVNGNLVAEKDQKKFQLATVLDKWDVTVDGRKVEARYYPDPTQNPKTIDLVYDEGPQKGKRFRGIYVLDGNVLRMCRCLEPDKERPTEFATTADSGLLLVEWKRVKR